MAFGPDTQINSFIAAEGFTPVDRDYFGSEDWNGQHRFPHYDRERWILHADNGLSDAEKAILAIDAVDGPLTHVRYKATSTHIPNAKDWQPPFRLLEITRFNLGPTLFESVRQAYEGAFTPSDADIESGPHVTWRFVFVSSKFQSADPVAVSRQVLTDAEAMAHKCFALSCFALSDPIGEGWSWNEIAVDEGEYPAAYEDIAGNGLTVPARIAGLLRIAGEIHSEYEMVLSSNVAGQDDVANGIVRYNMFLVDDDTSDWMVRREVGSSPPFWGQLRTIRMAGEPVRVPPAGFDPGHVEWTYIQTEGLPAWTYTLEFEADGHVTRYQAAINSEVSSYRSTNTTYFAVPRVPALIFARDGGFGIWFPLMERQPYLSEPPPLEKWLNMLRPTGSRVVLGQYEAVEYAVALSHPDQHKGRYLAWTGRIWFFPELPDSAGIQGLPGSPFAGRSVQFADFWETIGWDLNGRGLILRADLTLHDGLTEEQVLLLQGPLDPAHIADSDHDRQTVSMRIGNLAANETGVLSDIFPDLAPVSIAQWPYDLPPQTVGILERY